MASRFSLKTCAALGILDAGGSVSGAAKAAGVSRSALIRAKTEIGRPPLLPGRKKLAEGEGKCAKTLLRTTPELLEKAQRLADAAGISRNAWIEQLIERARS